MAGVTKRMEAEPVRYRGGTRRKAKGKRRKGRARTGFQHKSFFILERRFCGLLSVTHIYRRFTFLTEINDQSFSQIFEINSRKTKKMAA